MDVRSFALTLITSVAACSVPTSRPNTAPGPARAPSSADADGRPRPPVEVAAPGAARVGGGRIGKCEKRGDAAAFTLLHVNDLQAHYSDRIDGKSRYARIAGIFRAVREESPNTLVLDAGDDYEKGSILDLRTEGAVTRRVVHALPLDARALGNHDFAYGERAVREDVRASPHPVLSANMRDPDDADLFRAYTSFEVGCAKVGVFGLVTRPYGSDDEQNDTNYGAFAHDSRFVAIAERIVKRYRGEVDVMIALTHLGKVPDTYLAREVSGIDVVVGGHSEDVIAKPIRVLRNDGTTAFVVQTGRFGESVGRADIAIDLNARRVELERYALVPVDAAAPVDESIHALVARLEAETLPTLHDPIVNVARERAPRELVDILANAARAELGADAVLVGRDAFWGKLAAGPLSLQRLYDVVPVQKQPVGTAGFTSLWTIEIARADLDKIRSRVRKTSPFTLIEPAPGARAPQKTVRLVVEKRILEHPNLAIFGGDRLVDWKTGRFAGELIDVLEKHAKSQATKGVTFDAPL